MLLNHSSDFAKFETAPRAAKPEIAPGFPALRPAEPDAGFAAGTLIETSSGWRAAGDLKTGDLVQTLDGGLVPIASVTPRTLRRYSTQMWHIPEAALNNCEAFRVSAGQHVLLSETACETLFETPDVLIPVTALAGFRGIARCTAQSQTGTVELAFEREEIIYAQSGALLLCPAISGQSDGFFRKLNYGETRALLIMMTGAHLAPDLCASSAVLAA